MRRVAVLVLLAVPAPASAQFPGKDWPTGTPESQGLSSAGVGAAAEYARTHGGGSGCVIRHGVLVKEWGDPKHLADIKSATKGSVGATVLGLAVDAGLVKLDDLAQIHEPDLGTEKPGNVGTGWLKGVTVRQLATMTAGFDDGRPPKLVYKPGTKGIYSNDTANMLAELLTRKFGEDLRPVLKRKVMDPIGVPESGWAWRANQFRPKERGGLTTREFASGITITHRALARIGWLYLNDGEWAGRRILSREFVRAATTPTDLPAPFPYYGFYWGTNARGTFKGMPKDTFWALGLGDSFVVACPSLDVVAVRLGTGSKASQLPGDPDDWGGRVEGFFKLIVRAVRDPYPPSRVIRGITWASKEAIARKAKGSDNWPTTWGDDDALYTAYGDGNGFEPFVPEKLSLGFAKVTGTPPDVTGVNVRSPTGERKGDGKRGIKASGMLMVDGVLYLLARNAGHAQLAWSDNGGRDWEWADWKFTTSFGCPTFLNYGKNYAGARDNFVYVYSPDSDDAYTPADRMALARVPKDKLREQSAYEFFAGLDADGRPTWAKDIAKRVAVFEHRGKCYRSGITYHPATRQYLWCQTLPGGKPDPRFSGGFGVYAGPEPWGPWSTVYYTEEWDTGPGETSHFPTKWMSPDGRTAWLLFSGNDSFSLRKATLMLSDGTAEGGPFLDRVREHLARKYREKRPGREGDLVFLPSTTVGRLDTPALRRSAPRLWFYVTELATEYFEYPSVQVIVAARIDSAGQLTTTELLSPTYNRENREWAAQFHGLRAPTAGDRRKLAREIAGLYAVATFRGQLGAESFDGDRSTIDLWTNERNWRYRVEVTFDRAGTVAGVELKSVKTTDQEWRNRPAGVEDH